MNKLLKTILAASTALGALAVATPSQAISNYARQTGQACSSCHFQHYPLLNEFGRAFKAGGYTMGGKQGLIDGAGLSLTEVLNAGIVTKIRYQKSNGLTVGGKHTSNDGELQFPDELLLELGGRISENIGFQTDLSLNKNEIGTDSGNSTHVVDGMKIPFIYDVAGFKAGVIPFTTDGQGVAYGFELLNTGAVRGQRMVEARNTFSAQQYIGGGAGKAQGFALVASNSQFFANLSKWSPRFVGDKSGSPTATYLRVAATPSYGDWDLGVGLQSWSGHATNDGGVTVNTKAFALDGQAQGKVGAMPLGVYLSYAKADGTPAGGTPNHLNSFKHNGQVVYNPNAKTATAIAAELGVLPGKATVTLGYRNADNGAATHNGDNSLMIGGSYQIAQNVQLQLNHEMFSGSAYDVTPAPAKGDQLTTLMLFASF